VRLIRQGATALALLALAVGELLAQRRLTGRVVEEGTNQPLSSVSVSVTGTGTGTYTSDQGTFSLSVPNGAVTLRVRRIGFQLRTVLVQPNQASVEVALKRDVLQLEGVTVTSQASVVDRKNAATAVSQVQAEDINRVPAVQVDQALQGKIVGANINMNSGLPGGGAQIQIRGNSSLFGNGEPLFVIDGVLMSNAATSTGRNAITQAAPGLSGTTSTQDAPTNRLADLNPDDIENLEVLKGAAASALYGSRATNGVIIITTKRGRAGAPRWRFNQRVGTAELLRTVSSRRFPDAAAAIQSGNAVAGPAGQQLVRDAIAANGGQVPFFDYQGQLYGRTPLQYETSLSVDGGNENTRYRVGVTNNDNGGIAVNTGARRQSARFSVDQNVTSKLTAQFGLGANRFTADRGIDGNDNTYTSPLYAFGYTPAVVDLRRRADGTFPTNDFAGGGGINASNPFQTFQFLRNNETTNRYQANATLNYQLLASETNQLRFSLLGGLDRFDTDGSIVSPVFLQFENNDGLPGTNVQSQINSRQYNTSLAGIYTFSPRSLPFSGTTTAGISFEQQQINVFRIQSRGTIPTIGNVGAGQVTAGQNQELFRDQAFYAQQDFLAFDERLFLSAGFRADRSSANGDPSKWFYFPKAQGSYRFVNAVPKVDEFKLRAAWGRSGNRPTYGLRDLVLQNQGIIGGNNGLTVAPTNGNPFVEPEKLAETEFGFDAQLFSRRVSLEYTRFDRRISDALLPLNVAPSLGYSSFFGNGAKLSSKGHEVSAQWAVVQKTGFSWLSRATYFTVDETIDALPVPRFFLGSSGFGGGFGRTRIGAGLPTDNIWGNRMVYQPVLANGSPIQVNGRDSLIAVRADTLIAEATPKFLMSFFNNFTIGRFTINTQVDWRNGGFLSNLTNVLFDEAFNSRDFDAPSPCRGAQAQANGYLPLECRVPVGPDYPLGIVDTSATATFGRYRQAQNLDNGLATVYVQDGSFVKIREIAVAYLVPQSISRRLFGSRVTDVRLTAGGRNLGISTSYWGADPEVNNFGNRTVRGFVDLAPFPPSRTFFFNIDLGF
jgi:TonB-linked SusC/RagA family outer membrane protein